MKIKFGGYIPGMFESGIHMTRDDFEISLKYNVKDLILGDLYDQIMNDALTFYIDNEPYYEANEELLKYFNEHYVENAELFSCLDEISFYYIDGAILELSYDIILTVKDEKFEELLKG